MLRVNTSARVVVVVSNGVVVAGGCIACVDVSVVVVLACVVVDDGEVDCASMLEEEPPDVSRCGDGVIIEGGSVGRVVKCGGVACGRSC